MSDREPDSGWCAEPEFDLGFESEADRESEPGREPEAEFEQMYTEQHAFVWRCARRMGVPRHDLDDVLQDTFVAAYRRFDSWDRESRASTWLFGILRNVLRNRARGLRRHQRRLDALSHEPLPCTTHEGRGERLLASQLLHNFLAQLDEDKRAVFVLAELEGMTGSEIGLALAISPNTASSRLRLARQAFTEHFDPGALRRVERAARRAREQPEQPPLGAAQRSLALIMVGPAPSFGAASAAGLSTLGLAKLAMVASAAAIALVTLAVAPRLRASEPEARNSSLESAEASASPRARSRASAPSPSPSPSASVDTSSDEPPVLVIADALASPSRSLARSSSPPPREPGVDLAGYEALQAARERLLANQPAAALAWLDTIADADPALATARSATQIAALCQLDRASEARAIWSRMHASSPDSALVDRLRAACWTPD